jgi:hypothetical protein
MNVSAVFEAVQRGRFSIITFSEWYILPVEVHLKTILWRDELGRLAIRENTIVPRERKPSMKNPAQDTLHYLFSVRVLLVASPRITKPTQFLVNRRSVPFPLFHIIRLDTVYDGAL